jgi:hypothetical protein
MIKCTVTVIPIPNPGSAGAFLEAGIFNNANVMEYTNGASFTPNGYVPLH